MNQRTLTPSRLHIEAGLERAVDFLYRRQLPYGEFRTYASNDKELKKNCRFDSSPFVTAWVVDCLGHWQSARAKAMTKRARAFLRAEMEGPGIWRYWSSRNKSHEFLPPDVDDTCCISYVLQKNKFKLANRELILANRNSEGLFYTWVIPREDSPKHVVKTLEPLINPGASALWSIAGISDNIDLAVNANVLLYLGESAETRATITYLIDTVYGKLPERGVRFYPDELALYYFLARAYCNGVSAFQEIQSEITNHVLATQKRDGSFGNELTTALAISTLLNFGQQPRELVRGVENLLRLQGRNGAWQRICAFLGPAPYYGSAELTTALCVQALAHYYLLDAQT